MIAPEGTSSTRRRAGLTLVEVMLVLALVVFMAAIIWPALERPMAAQRLREAGDQVRGVWVRTRVRAMSTGQTYLFRCAAGSSQYVVEAQAGLEPATRGVATADAMAAPLTLDSSTVSAYAEEGTLPEGIVFYSGDAAVEAAAEARPYDANLADQMWSEPILFFPDGTTSTAALQLRNEYDRTIQLSLRGLTGTVTVGEIEALEDGSW